MKNQIQRYEWGSRDYIANLLKLEKNETEPWAELWLSAHDKAPSLLLETQTQLNEAITANPQEFLGKKIALEYKNKLPYLLKILSAEKPLSIQAHPNLDEAQRGFRRENEQGIPLTDFVRNYKDDNHKPELICALTEFHAMCGFRPASEIIDFFKKLGFSKILKTFSAFKKEPSSGNMKNLFSEIINAGLGKKQQILEMTIKKYHRLKDEFIKAWITKLLEFYPNDIGVISPLFLNTFILQPGQAIFLKAGVLHAYLQGTGVEIMANSDNVLRGGLTPKNIDVDELVSLLQWEMKEPDVQSYNPEQDMINYQVPVAEFSLKRINLKGEISLDSSKPTMLIVISGEVEVSCQEENKSLVQGESLFVTAEAKKLKLLGEALVFLAATND